MTTSASIEDNTNNFGSTEMDFPSNTRDMEEEKLDIFQFLRKNVGLIKDNPVVVLNIEEGLRQLEKKFTKYAKSITEVIRVHKEIQNDNVRLRTVSTSQEAKILLGKNQLKLKSRSCIKLKKISQRLNRKNKNCEQEIKHLRTMLHQNGPKDSSVSSKGILDNRVVEATTGKPKITQNNYL